MKVKEAVDYLNKIDPEEEVRIVTVDTKKRVQYITEKIILTDLGKPAMIERVIGEEPFSEKEMMAADECERPNVLRESKKDIEWECGCCGERHVEEKDDKSGYCRRCGQFINWWKEEENESQECKEVGGHRADISIPVGEVER